MVIGGGRSLEPWRIHRNARPIGIDLDLGLAIEDADGADLVARDLAAAAEHRQELARIGARPCGRYSSRNHTRLTARPPPCAALAIVEPVGPAEVARPLRRYVRAACARRGQVGIADFLPAGRCAR